MKKIFKPILYGCLFICGIIKQAQAQEPVTLVTENKGANLVAITTTSTDLAGTPLVRVNPKLERIFVKSYKNAENVKWYRNGNGYLAMFDWEGVKAHAAYARKGYWYYDVRFGTERNLSVAERRLIESDYADYTIGTATEVNLGGTDKAWVVNLENADNLVRVRIMDGRLEELARYDMHPTPKLHRKARIEIPQ